MTNHVQSGRVCIKHGAKVQRCSNEGCLNDSSEEEYARGMGRIAMHKKNLLRLDQILR